MYMSFRVKLGRFYTLLQSTVDGFGTATTTGVACFVKYTLYDGPDALIANKLLELGVTVNPNNVDWYKRTLIEQASAPAMNGGVA